MVKRMVIMLVGVAIVAGVLIYLHIVSGLFVQKLVAKMQNPPQAVSTIKAVASNWATTLEAVGSLRAVRGANLSLQVGGIVDSIHFKSGETVAKGDLLLRLDASVDQAHLNALQATASLAETTLDRDKKQFAVHAISQQTLDADEANLKQARANVAQARAALDHKTLRAPFSGRLGLREVDLGQFLNPGTAVVTLQALNPIFADFYLPQQALAKVHDGMPVTARTDTYPGRVFTGKILAINPKVDVDTRNVRIRARLDNPDDKLRPGMYVTVDVTTGAPTPQVTLPQTAITYHSYGSTVFLVESAPAADKAATANPQSPDQGKQPELIAREQFVTTGATRGDQIQILEGVKAGEIVVTAGQLKLHNGSRLTINNKIQPSNDAHPTPQEH